ncbi:MAG TPA: CAP domain-containing protein [Thermoanaerobaculia bacterium]|nr:CAP domain-containing protein [Thermoanaerobaculia bacterium]
MRRRGHPRPRARVFSLAFLALLVAWAPASCSPPGGSGPPAATDPEAAGRGGGAGEPGTPAATSRRTAIDAGIVQAVNRVRSENDLAPLAVDASLNAAAREHSRRMAGGRVSFGHDDFAQRVASLPARPQAAAENVARLVSSTDAVDRVLEEWSTSRSHRNNLLGDWSHTGIGVASARDGSLYVTQIYARLP